MFLVREPQSARQLRLHLLFGYLVTVTTGRMWMWSSDVMILGVVTTVMRVEG
jgi:hypothetical protein